MALDSYLALEIHTGEGAFPSPRLVSTLEASGKNIPIINLADPSLHSG